MSERTADNDAGVTPNRPRCPICSAPLHLYATIADDVSAECPKCEWRWRG